MTERCPACGQEKKQEWGSAEKPYVPVPKKDLPDDFTEKAEMLLLGELDDGFRTMVKNCMKYKKISEKQENWFNAVYKKCFGDQVPTARTALTEHRKPKDAAEAEQWDKTLMDTF